MKKADEMTKKWVDNWIQTGEELERMRREKIRNGSIIFEINALNSAFQSSLKKSEPTVTSGLVEFQDLIKKLRKDD